MGIRTTLVDCSRTPLLASTCIYELRVLSMSSSHLLPSSPAESQRVLSVLAGFTASFPKRPHPLRLRREGGDVILLTGTTGGFGCNILSQLSLDPSVAKIYALNRASPREGLASRQMKALAQRGILEECQKFSKFQLVEADLSKPNLGLTPELYTEVSL